MTTKRTDEELVASFQSGDVSAFNLLLRNFHGFIVKNAGIIFNDFASASKVEFEDIISICRAALLIATKNYKEENGSFKNYYLVIMKNSVMDFIKENIAYNEHRVIFSDDLYFDGVFSSGEDVPKDYENNELLNSIKKGLKNKDIKRIDAEMFELFYFENYSITQIAELYNMKEPTIRRKINIVKDKLMHILFNSKK